MGYSREQLQRFAIMATAASQYLAINGQLSQGSDFLLGEPLTDNTSNGHVIDFIQWHVAGYYWPAFNVADSAICVGAVLLVWDAIRQPNSNPKESESS